MLKKRLLAIAMVCIMLHCSCAAQPVQDSASAKEHDLVELVKIDTSIHLEIKYATNDNFVKRPLYTEARAFLQRPAAMALVEVNKELKLMGYGLLVFDAYRPWSVTKLLWDSTSDENKQFVADPAKGSRHNRGAAVDLTLYELSSGKEVQMPGHFDEMTERSHSTYTGGTIEQRTMRDLLRNKMEAHGFQVLENEWWHFDYKDWRSYPIGNTSFENIKVN